MSISSMQAKPFVLGGHSKLGANCGLLVDDFNPLHTLGQII